MHNKNEHFNVKLLASFAKGQVLSKRGNKNNGINNYPKAATVGETREGNV